MNEQIKEAVIAKVYTWTAPGYSKIWTCTIRTDQNHDLELEKQRKLAEAHILGT